MLSKDINRALSDLINSGAIDSPPTFATPEIKVHDVYPLFKHLFNERALTTMENKATQLIYQYNEEVVGGKALVLLGKLGLKTCLLYKDADPSMLYTRKFDKVEFVASRCTRDKLNESVQKVINTVNHLADKKFTKASMLQLGVMELQPINSAEREYVVISYITLTKKGSNYVKTNIPQMFVEEGGIPTKVDAQ